MATTRPLAPQPIKESAVDVRFRSIAAQVIIPYGSIGCNDAGAAKPFTDALFQAGATLLGCSMGTYDNLAINAVTAKDMLFRRACDVLLPKAKAGDVPTAAAVGKEISLEDNETVKATKGNTDVGVTLLEILPGGAGYRVRLP